MQPPLGNENCGRIRGVAAGGGWMVGVDLGRGVDWGGCGLGGGGVPMTHV